MGDIRGPTRIEIRHNAAARRFEATVDRLLCRCDYRMHGNTMMLVHTEVRPSLKGVASPRCWYALRSITPGTTGWTFCRCARSSAPGHGAIPKSTRCWQGNLPALGSAPLRSDGRQRLAVLRRLNPHLR